jgi:hypothetical protein
VGPQIEKHKTECKRLYVCTVVISLTTTLPYLTLIYGHLNKGSASFSFFPFSLSSFLPCPPPFTFLVFFFLSLLLNHWAIATAFEASKVLYHLPLLLPSSHSIIHHPSSIIHHSSFLKSQRVCTVASPLSGTGSD